MFPVPWLKIRYSKQLFSLDILINCQKKNTTPESLPSFIPAEWCFLLHCARKAHLLRYISNCIKVTRLKGEIHNYCDCNINPVSSTVNVRYCISTNTVSASNNCSSIRRLFFFLSHQVPLLSLNFNLWMLIND